MTDEKNETTSQALAKHAAGMAIVATTCGAGGVLFGAMKGSSIKDSAAIGVGIGALASLGFGKVVYETIAKPAKNEPQSHADRIKSERLASRPLQR